MREEREQGFVTLAGAGPGDEGLLTVKAAERLRQADTVVYDYLAGTGLLRHCNADCERIYAGKQAGRHRYSQEEITALLVDRARAGRRVVRLKGGDPFVFGRGGEEALALAEANIPFEVIPGVTSGVAAPAYAGIPLTHRGEAGSLAFITGHAAEGTPERQEEWRRAAGADTLVFFMGVKNLRAILEQVKAAGRTPETPAAAVRWGTTAAQECLTATVGTLADRAEAEGLAPPALVVIGTVVALRKQINWFERLPLFGRQILVTRSAEQAPPLAAELRELGAAVSEMPAIEIIPYADLSALDRSLADLGAYHWLVFTSLQGVRIFFRRLAEREMDARALAGCRVAAIGSRTAEELRSRGIAADLVPEEFTSEGTVTAFRAAGCDLSGARVLLPCSEIAREVIPEGLRELGAVVETLPIYRTLAPEYSAEELERLLDPEPELVTLTSSSTARNLAAILRGHGREALLSRLAALSIGPVTSQTARELGIPVAAEAGEHSAAGLVEAARRWGLQPGSSPSASSASFPSNESTTKEPL